MILIVGLGNPKRRFILTRHNVGFLFIDHLKKLGKFGPFKESKKFEAKTTKGKIFGKVVFLVKPLTFMNSSGRAVLKIARYYKVPKRNIWVVHDDADIEIGRIKISRGKSSGGHKGVESLIQNLGSKNFLRLRIGIAPLSENEKLKVKEKGLEKFVLERFSKKEREVLKEVFKIGTKAVEVLLKEGVEKAMSEFNKKDAPFESVRRHSYEP